FAEQALRRPRVEGAMVDRVVDRLDREEPIPIEEMQFFVTRQAQLRVLAQVGIERGRPALLRTCDNEAYLRPYRHRSPGCRSVCAQSPLNSRCRGGDRRTPAATRAPRGTSARPR